MREEEQVLARVNAWYPAISDYGSHYRLTVAQVSYCRSQALAVRQVRRRTHVRARNATWQSSISGFRSDKVCVRTTGGANLDDLVARTAASKGCADSRASRCEHLHVNVVARDRRRLDELPMGA